MASLLCCHNLVELDWRNYFMFGRSKDIPVDTGSFLRAKIDEVWRASHGDGTAATLQTGPKTEVLISWKSPPHNWFCLNTNGASKGAPGLAGGGGIIRDSRGIFIQGLVVNLGICNAYRAERATAELGLKMARNMGIT